MTSANIDTLRNAVIPLTGSKQDYDELLDSIGDKQFVLLGEATHGTQEFYEIRAHITKRLLEEKNFTAIAIEGDWPDAYQINRYIHEQKYTNAKEALAVFTQFPSWMWRNVPMLTFVEWLADFNKQKSPEKKVSLYGLDLYSLYRSINAVITYLKKIDPAAAVEAEYHYSCFNNFKNDPQAYGYFVAQKAIKSCEYEVIEELKRLQNQDWDYLSKSGLTADEAFYAEQNARVVKNAEKYYRSLFIDEVSNWNLRDSHMMETLEALVKHHELKGIKKPKIVIWAHNSHCGNAQATEMGKRGELNIGQLVQEKYGSNNSVLVGFTTYKGHVSAASQWHGPVEHKKVLPALPESYEALFHELKIPNFLLLLDKNKKLVPEKLLERAIGVIYLPRTERASHYFYAQLAEQFDAVIHYDITRAVEPLEKGSHWISGEVPEAYPSGL